MADYYPVGALMALPSGALRVTRGPTERGQSITRQGPASPTLSRLTVPVRENVPPHCLGRPEKVAFAASSSKLKGRIRTPEPCFPSPLLPICPSRWTRADGGFGRKMDGWMVNSALQRRKEPESGRGGVGEMYGSPHRLRQNDR